MIRRALLSFLAFAVAASAFAADVELEALRRDYALTTSVPPPIRSSRATLPLTPRRTGLTQVREAFVRLLARDEDFLRYNAADTLAAHSNADFDARVRQLLHDPDLRVRGAAAYAAGVRFKEAVVPMLAAWLDDPSDLLRYEAVSVMLEYGGAAGRAKLHELRDSGKAKDGRIRAILERMDERRQDDGP